MMVLALVGCGSQPAPPPPAPVRSAVESSLAPSLEQLPTRLDPPPPIPILFQQPPTGQPRDFDRNRPPDQVWDSHRLWAFEQSGDTDWVVELRAGERLAVEDHIVEVERSADDRHLFLRQFVQEPPGTPDRWRERLGVVEQRTLAATEIPTQRCTEGSARWVGEHLVTLGRDEAEASQACVWSARGELLHRVRLDPYRDGASEMFAGRLGVLPDAPDTLAHVHPGHCRVELLDTRSGEVRVVELARAKDEPSGVPCQEASDWWDARR